MPNWTVETLNPTVDAEAAALSAPMRARISRISALIETVGLENVHEPHLKHLEGPLWEMRVKTQDGIARALYVTGQPQRVVIVRVFVKKTEKTPRREINLALKRSQEITP